MTSTELKADVCTEGQPDEVQLFTREELTEFERVERARRLARNDWTDPKVQERAMRGEIDEDGYPCMRVGACICVEDIQECVEWSVDWRITKDEAAEMMKAVTDGFYSQLDHINECADVCEEFTDFFEWLMKGALTLGRCQTVGDCCRYFRAYSAQCMVEDAANDEKARREAGPNSESACRAFFGVTTNGD